MISALVAWAELPAQPTYTPHEIGTLGGNYSEATGINNAGQIIGRSLRADGRTHAFLQTGAVMTDLGTLPGDVGSDAIAINSRGDVVGTSRSSRGIDRGFLYRNGTMTEIVATPPAYSMLPRDINDAGQVVGLWRRATEPDFTRPFVYVDGRFTDLGELGGMTRTAAEGINNAGVIIGGNDRTDLGGFIAQPDGTVANLGAVGGRPAYPFAIADNGLVLVTTTTFGSDLQMHRYEGGRTSPYGRPGTDALAIMPKAMNNAGQVVGYTRAGFGQPQAVLFTEADPINLNTRIPAGSFGRLTDANGINDSGAIVGRFERADSSPRGFLLVPPAAGAPTIRVAPASQSVPTG
ncbi:MAG: hypothetical protein JNL61_07520, partial [Rhizobiaceae bacterium]|nr:hypothetical protein [Rhizobiaceae bacterium]